MEILDISLDDVSVKEAQCDLVEVVEIDDVNYDQFYRKYLLANVPCVVRGVSKEWSAQKDWVADGLPNLNYIEQTYGLAQVPVSSCNERQYNAQAKKTMSMENFIEYWRKLRDSGVDECLYLKDWHCANEYPNDVYRVPKVFASDWLNEYLVSGCARDDYRFVYMGPRGTWTPLHKDVFSSFSWSVNLCGSKKWSFYPPWEEHCLKDKIGNLMYDLGSDRGKNEFPCYSLSKGSIDLIQGPGDAVFVPSGWFHQVWNLEDTISINHNWGNAANIHLMWSSLNETFAAVQKEISDCADMPEWDDQCQLLLKSTYGLNHTEFMEFLFFICDRRIDHVNRRELLPILGNYLLSLGHIAFDLSALLRIFESALALDVKCLILIRDELKRRVNQIKETNCIENN